MQHLQGPTSCPIREHVRNKTTIHLILYVVCFFHEVFGFGHTESATPKRMAVTSLRQLSSSIWCQGLRYAGLVIWLGGNQEACDREKLKGAQLTQSFSSLLPSGQCFLLFEHIRETRWSPENILGFTLLLCSCFTNKQRKNECLHPENSPQPFIQAEYKCSCSTILS